MCALKEASLAGKRRSDKWQICLKVVLSAMLSDACFSSHFKLAENLQPQKLSISLDLYMDWSV